MYKTKSNWNTLELNAVSKEVARLLGVSESKILRIGNDTTEEKEMSHMDGIFLRSKIKSTETKNPNNVLFGDSEFFLCEFEGKKFIREVFDDVIAYFIINETNDETISQEGFILLKSVGTSFDFKTNMTYPTAVDNSSDTDNGFHLTEIENDEWWEKLSVEDKKMLPKEFQKITLNDLKNMEPGVFASGEIENSEDGLFMTSSNIGKKLLWVAKRGGFHDWAIYAHWAENGLDYVLTQGDKVSKYNVRKLVNCTEDALNMYRS